MLEDKGRHTDWFVGSLPWPLAKQPLLPLCRVPLVSLGCPSAPSPLDLFPFPIHPFLGHSIMTT
ncbi:hypothetical protein AERO9A_140199 [Aeromonas salmonicida]|nr:hypothetical protein AERO9A_140199 [Aeromonas salmonicida]